MAYEIVCESESKRYRSDCASVLTKTCEILKSKNIIAQFSLVGSGAKNLITRNGNGPYDLDYNLVVIKADERYWKDLRLLKDTVPVALSRFLDEHPSVRKIHLHLDNDAVGRGAVKGIVGGLQGKYQAYDEPPAHGKDVNDELKIRVGLMRERKERERT